jgi:hypothetical protein
MVEGTSCVDTRPHPSMEGKGQNGGGGSGGDEVVAATRVVRPHVVRVPPRGGLCHRRLE